MLDAPGAAANSATVVAGIEPDVAAVHADEITTRQFVTFHLGRETFAVPLTEVQEIIRLPVLVDVPRAPADLEGLANLRGSVLPILNLRRIFSLDAVEHNDATRVVVINNGSPLGFVVDSMARVVTAERHEIDGIEGLRATVDSAFLDGIIKHGQAMIMILNTGKLGLKTRQAGHCATTSTPADGGAVARRERDTVADDEAQLVSFELDDQEYAMPIDSVQEIVQVPDTITALPNAQTRVLGVMNLRNQLLPLVSLRSLFGLPSTALNEQSRVVVVTHAIDGAQHAVGLVTDTVKEVLHVNRAIIDPLPSMLAARSGLHDIDQICRLDQGKRLVSILQPDRLFAATQLRDVLAAGTDDRSDKERNEMSVASRERIDDEEQFVVFRIAGEEYGVPIETVQEIVRIPDKITRVPKAPDFIEGVVNLRGAVLPVVDQRQRFGLARMEHNDRQRIMVFLVHGVRTGFIVDSVSEVLKISRAEIAAAPESATAEESAVARVANIVKLKRMILMLDVDRLLSRGETGALSRAA